jgi:hypothetical protein
LFFLYDIHPHARKVVELPNVASADVLKEEQEESHTTEEVSAIRRGLSI